MRLVWQSLVQSPRALSVASAIAFLLLPSATCAEGMFRGYVVSVADGDTITVRADINKETFRVRLDGIDAPERTQPYSQVSRRNLEALVKGKAVTVATTKVDRYGRLVATVSTPEAPDVGLEQIKAGLAWHFKRYVRSCFRLSTILPIGEVPPTVRRTE